MARIIENENGRRSIIVTTDDVINIVREYQNIAYNKVNYDEIRNALNKRVLYLPEDI